MPPPCTVFFTMDSVRSTPYAQLWATCDSECGRAPILKDGNARSPAYHRDVPIGTSLLYYGEGENMPAGNGGHFLNPYPIALFIIK